MPEAYVAPTAGDGKTIQIGDVSLYYDEKGAGDVVVLLHGGIMDHQSWGNQIPVLSKRYRVISPDTRGHGRSSDTSAPFSYEVFADDLEQLLRELGVGKATLVGFSDGGCTSLALARRRPELVDRLVLIGTPYSTENYYPGIVDRFASLSSDDFLNAAGDDSVMAELVRKAKGGYPNQEAWLRMWSKLVNKLWVSEPALTLTELAEIRVPTLVVHGEHEQYIQRSAAESLANALPNGSFVEIGAVNHSSPQLASEAVNSHIIQFLSA